MKVRDRQSAPHRRLPKSTRRWCAVGLLVLGPVAVLLLYPDAYVSAEGWREGALSIARLVSSIGDFGILLFLLVQTTAAAISLPLVPVLSVLGGFLFETWAGAAVVYVGTLLGSIAAFLLARTACGEALRRRVETRLGGVGREIVRNGFFYILVLRLLPVMPFWMANVVPAALDIRLDRYLAASVIGLAPWALLYSAVGHGLGRVLFRGDISFGEVMMAPEVAVPMLALATLTLAAAWLRHWRRLRPGWTWLRRR